MRVGAAGFFATFQSLLYFCMELRHFSTKLVRVLSIANTPSEPTPQGRRNRKIFTLQLHRGFEGYDDWNIPPWKVNVTLIVSRATTDSSNSGSQTMAFVMALQQGWSPTALRFQGTERPTANPSGR
jgi:hypothetical protein